MASGGPFESHRAPRAGCAGWTWAGHLSFGGGEGHMKNGRRIVMAALVAASMGVTAVVLGAQLEHMPMQLKFNQGQAVQPIFDGWSRNEDGSYTMHFGYLNRNYIEEPHAPIGPLNRIEPGGPDRGQPTYFYPRTNRAKFKVQVPKDFGKNEVVWTGTTKTSETDGGRTAIKSTVEAVVKSLAEKNLLSRQQ